MERELRRLMLIVEDDIESWHVWHCSSSACKHHTCKVRKEKLEHLKHLHRELYLRWKMVRSNNREISSV